MRLTHLLLVAALTASCRPAPDHAREGSAPDEEPRAEVTEPSADPSGDPDLPSGIVVQDDQPPAIRLAGQNCSDDSECRVFQPGDWNERVECCYEYSCDLDYVAINQATWDEVRGWQAAHPFDCATHLQQEGPCNNRSPRCGLMQDPPSAACVDGLCRIALPAGWPAVDPSAQRCTGSSDCLAYRPATTTTLDRCCDANCDDEWRAINRATAEELDRWRNHHAEPCDAWRADNQCPPAIHCNLSAPVATCAGGECVLSE